jgi:hypothetical protein
VELVEVVNLRVVVLEGLEARLIVSVEGLVSLEKLTSSAV